VQESGIVQVFGRRQLDFMRRGARLSSHDLTDSGLKVATDDMNTGFGSWLLGMSLGASALGGMLGIASSIFIVLAATTFGSALLYSISGFGFAVLAAPLFLLFLDPARAFSSSSSSRRCYRSLCFGGCCRLSLRGW